MKIERRFNCPRCGFFSEPCLKAEEMQCPECGRPMDAGLWEGRPGNMRLLEIPKNAPTHRMFFEYPERNEPAAEEDLDEYRAEKTESDTLDLF